MNTGIGPSSKPDSPLSIPSHELIRPIGVGSYGQVWLAFDTTLHTYRAVKIIRACDGDDTQALNREFAGLRAYEPVSRGHPGLVQILWVGLSPGGGQLLYVMELADDLEHGLQVEPERYRPRTLQAERRRRGKLPIEECWQIGRQVAGALSHLHASGLVHRDIKPQNIIFVRGQPKLADIGLVCPAIRARTFVGTEGYVPPEGPGTPSADVYALGKVLYEISTGKDCLEFPELPEELASSPNRAEWLQLNEIILRACAPNPAERYQSAAEMAEDLASAGSTSGLRRFRRRVHRTTWRRRWAWAVGLGSIVLIGVVAAVALFHRGRADELDRVRVRWMSPVGFHSPVVLERADGHPAIVVGNGTDCLVLGPNGRHQGHLASVGFPCFAGDSDGNGAAELFVQRRTKDGRVTVESMDLSGRRLHQFSVHGRPDTEVRPFYLGDLEGDGNKELIVILASGFSLGPRGVAIFDVASGSELARYEIGPGVRGCPWVGPLFGDGEARIVFGSAGPANGRVGPDGSRDSAAYVWCLDHRGRLVWRRGPLNQGGFFNTDVLVPRIRHDMRRMVIVGCTEHGWSPWDGRAGRILLLNVENGNDIPDGQREFDGPIHLVDALVPGPMLPPAILLVHASPMRRALLQWVDLAPGLPDRVVADLGPQMPEEVKVADLDADGYVEVLAGVGPELVLLDHTLRERARFRTTPEMGGRIYHIHLHPQLPVASPRVFLEVGPDDHSRRVVALDIRIR